MQSVLRNDGRDKKENRSGAWKGDTSGTSGFTDHANLSVGYHRESMTDRLLRADDSKGKPERQETALPRRQGGRGCLRALRSLSSDSLIMVGGGCGRGPVTHPKSKKIVLDVGRIQETKLSY